MATRYKGLWSHVFLNMIKFMVQNSFPVHFIMMFVSSLSVLVRMVSKIYFDSCSFAEKVNSTIALLHPIHCTRDRNVEVVFDMTTIPAFLVVFFILWLVLKPKRAKPKINWFFLGKVNISSSCRNQFVYTEFCRAAVNKIICKGIFALVDFVLVYSKWKLQWDPKKRKLYTFRALKYGYKNLLLMRLHAYKPLLFVINFLSPFCYCFLNVICFNI